MWKQRCKSRLLPSTSMVCPSSRTVSGVMDISSLPFFPPAVKQDAYIKLLGKIIKQFAAGSPVHLAAALFEIQGRSQNGGAAITVDQRKLVFKETDQFFRLCPLAQQAERIISSDPAAACGSGSSAWAP